MHRRVILEDEFGDHHRGVEHTGRSDEPDTITVGSTVWYTTTWRRNGWTVVEAGEWQQ